VLDAENQLFYLASNGDRWWWRTALACAEKAAAAMGRTPGAVKRACKPGTPLSSRILTEEEARKVSDRPQQPEAGKDIKNAEQTKPERRRKRTRIRTADVVVPLPAASTVTVTIAEGVSFEVTPGGLYAKMVVTASEMRLYKAEKA